MRRTALLPRRFMREGFRLVFEWWMAFRLRVAPKKHAACSLVACNSDCRLRPVSSGNAGGRQGALLQECRSFPLLAARAFPLAV